MENTKKSVIRVISSTLVVMLILSVIQMPQPLITAQGKNAAASDKNQVLAASDSVTKYRNKITKNRKYIQKKVKIYKGKESYLTKAKSYEKKSMNTTSVNLLKSYNKKVASYANKIKKIDKRKKARVSWHKAPKIAGKKSIKWSSVDKGCKKLLGIKYKWGGTTKKSGFDCSGLVSYVLDKNYGLPYTRYTSSTIKSKWGNTKYEVYDSDVDGSLDQAIDDDRVQPGDILVHSRNGKAYHVSIFAGYEEWGPVQYDSYGEVVKRYVLTDRRIQAIRGLYTKPSTSKKISKYRNTITKLSEESLEEADNKEQSLENINEKLSDAESYYNDILQNEGHMGQSTLSEQAKALYDECIALSQSIKSDKNLLSTTQDTLANLQAKARNNRKPSTLKKYKSKATSCTSQIAKAIERLNAGSTKFESNLSQLKDLSAQASQLQSLN